MEEYNYEDGAEGEVEAEPRPGKKIAYDMRVIPVLEDIKRAPLQNNHSIIAITGRVGTGKSKLARDWAYYLDPDFGIDQIVFTHEELIEKGLKLGRGKAIIFDEAREGTMSTQAMSQSNQRVGLFLDTVRSKCLFIFLLQPSPWNFQKSIFCESADIHLHVFKAKTKNYDRNNPAALPFERGHYDIYSFERKRLLYMKGKKWSVFPKSVKPSITNCRFGSRQVIDEDEYQSRKDAAVAAMNTDAEAVEIDRNKGDTRVNTLRLNYLKSFKNNWPSLTLDTFSQLSGENKRVLLLSMDIEARQMYGIGAHTKV